MEGGSPVLEYVTYGVLGLVVLAIAILALRSAWFFLSLLAIPLAETVGRWRPFRGAVERWGARGAEADPRLWAAVPADGAAPVPTRSASPRAVRLGTRVGALLGVLPGVWLGLRDATRVATGADAAWALFMGIALLGGAGLLLGIALGAGAGLLVAVARHD